MMPLFDHYLFADYSGAGKPGKPNKSIKLFMACVGGQATEQKPSMGSRFSRDELLSKTSSVLDAATASNERVIFGLDFQYSWPLDMLAHVGLQGLPWRQVVAKLASGDKQTGLPPMSVPKTYCKQLNTWLVGKKKDKLYWCPLKGRASSYGIPQSSPVPKGFQVYRLTELQSPLKGESKPKPANAVGGMGLGIVGGQTICGVPQIGRLLARQDVAVWPFDGLDIADPSYADKHVAVEIYPSAIRPAGVPQTDENDARCSTEYVQEHDAAGTLQSLLNLTGISAQYQQQVLLEGWILGMNPAGL